MTHFISKLGRCKGFLPKDTLLETREENDKGVVRAEQGQENPEETRLFS